MFEYPMYPSTLSRRLIFLWIICMNQIQTRDVTLVSSTFIHGARPQVRTNQVAVPKGHHPEDQRWYMPDFTFLPSGELSEPINSPPLPMSQEYARLLSQYMQNVRADASYGSQLNLGQMNSRAQVPVKVDNRSYGALPGSSLMTELVAPQTSIRRDDVLVRKGKVDDVLIFKEPGIKGNQRHWLRPPPLKHTPLKEKFFFENCITRATKLVSICEDHLVRRLFQDAAEGRTVIDVGRRVCCALFWHKDCVSSKVIQACPDSSPAAVDYLLGSRKVDLTLSCQRFNRDGCNAAHSISPSLCYLPVIASILITLYNTILH